jgi:HAD superfamily hydrolase (TIGR01509 family)
MNAQPVIVFDCDGVLIDSEGLAADALVAELSCRRMNVPVAEALEHFTGLSAADAAQELHARYGFVIPDDFWDRVRGRREDLYRAKLKPADGIFALLESISDPKCVASSSSPASLKSSLSLVSLWDHFTPHIFSSVFVKNGKPAPDLFLFAAERMRASPQDCVVIEDSLAGIRAAKAAHMRVLGYVGGSHCSAEHIERVQGEGVEKIFRSHNELKDYLEDERTGRRPVEYGRGPR